MALAIPYPDMDFVPLDILTAAEQDQLVANIEYIANQFPLAGSNIGTGAIGTSQLASGAVTSAKLDSSIVAISNYSLTEVATSATWVDGKTIYKKTVHIGALPNVATTDYPSGITNMDTLVELSGFAYRSSDTATAPLPFATPAGQAIGSILLMYIKSNSSIRITTGTDRSAFDGYVTLYYTKTA